MRVVPEDFPSVLQDALWHLKIMMPDPIDAPEPYRKRWEDAMLHLDDATALLQDIATEMEEGTLR